MEPREERILIALNEGLEKEARHVSRPQDHPKG